MNTELYDVLGVTIATGGVRLMDARKTAANADAVMKMAVIRRGVETEFFVVVNAGAYKDGEQWEGKR